MDLTTMPSEERTLFATEDNQSVFEIGEQEGSGTFVVGALVITKAKIVKSKGRWRLRGEIPLKILASK